MMKDLKGRALALVLAIMLAIGLVGALPASGLAEGLSLSDLLDQAKGEQASEERDDELPANGMADGLSLSDLLDQLKGEQASENSGAEKAPMGESILMAEEYADDELFDNQTYYALGSDIPHASVRSIRFVDSMNGAPQDAWDASQAGDGSVLAWVEPSGELYDLTIAGNGKVALSSGRTLFAYYTSLEEIDFNGCVDTSSVSDMGRMFQECRNLASLDLSGFDTRNVTDMSGMFNGCESLKSLDVSGFDTSNVTDMRWMFERCSTLTSLDLSGFDTSNVPSMVFMFSECANLKSLDLSGFDTASATNMVCMFNECSSLESLDLSGFDTANVTDMALMFYRCSSLKSLDLSGFDTANVTGMDNMFCDCASLTSLDVSGFNTANVTNMSYMFSGCSSLESLDVSGFDTANVTDMNSMFNGCSSLKRLVLNSFDTHNVKDMRHMLSGLTSLQGLGFGVGFAIGENTKVEGILDQSPLAMVNLQNGMNRIAEEEASLPESEKGNSGTYLIPFPEIPDRPIDSFVGPRFPEENTLRYFSTSGLREVFGNSDYDRSQIRSVRFEDSLESVPEGAWDVSRDSTGAVLAWLEPNGELYDLTIAAEGGVRMNEESEFLFQSYDHLESVSFNNNVYMGDVRIMAGMFQNCTRLKELVFFDGAPGSNMSAENVKDLSEMFKGCESLTEVDLSWLMTDRVHRFDSMFQGCSKLERIQVSCGFVAPTQHSSTAYNPLDGEITETDVSDMFDGCDATILWRDDGVEADMSCDDWLRMISIRPNTTLENGGDIVKWLQRMLISKGLLPKGSDDGIFGDNTQEAWRRFREDNVWFRNVIDWFGPNILTEEMICTLVERPFEEISVIPPEPDIP